MNDFWETELTDEESDALIQKAADEIRKRKMEAPAILMLEMHKPLSYVASNAAIVFSPFLVPFFGFDTVNDYTRLFSKRENVERLIDRLEEARKEPEKEKAV